MTENRCCYIRPSGRQCPSVGEWEIQEQGKPYSDTKTCSHHLGEMMTVGVNIVYALDEQGEVPEP